MKKTLLILSLSAFSVCYFLPNEAHAQGASSDSGSGSGSDSVAGSSAELGQDAIRREQQKKPLENFEYKKREQQNQRSKEIEQRRPVEYR